jgi:hypothetical protein
MSESKIRESEMREPEQAFDGARTNLGSIALDD